MLLIVAFAAEPMLLASVKIVNKSYLMRACPRDFVLYKLYFF